jgi:hypothetical protein
MFRYKAPVFMSKKHNKEEHYAPPQYFLAYFASFDIKKATSFINEMAFLLQK